MDKANKQIAYRRLFLFHWKKAYTNVIEAKPHLTPLATPIKPTELNTNKNFTNCCLLLIASAHSCVVSLYILNTIKYDNIT